RLHSIALDDLGIRRGEGLFPFFFLWLPPRWLRRVFYVVKLRSTFLTAGRRGSVTNRCSAVKSLSPRRACESRHRAIQSPSRSPRGDTTICRRGCCSRNRAFRQVPRSL